MKKKKRRDNTEVKETFIKKESANNVLKEIKGLLQ